MKNVMCGSCVSMGERGVAYGNLEGKTVGRMPLVRPRHRLENNIETDFLGIK